MAANGYAEHSPGKYSLVAVFIAEVLLTAVFLYVILGATDTRAPQGFAPIAIGLVLTLIHLISIPISNTSVNPARSTGVAFFNGNGAVGQLLVVLAGPDPRCRHRRRDVPPDHRCRPSRPRHLRRDRPRGPPRDRLTLARPAPPDRTPFTAGGRGPRHPGRCWRAPRRSAGRSGRPTPRRGRARCRAAAAGCPGGTTGGRACRCSRSRRRAPASPTEATPNHRSWCGAGGRRR